MHCPLAFVSDLTYLRSGAKLGDILALDADPLAITDNANLGNIVALAKSGKRFIPAVEMYTATTYDQTARPGSPVALYAFTPDAYSAMCRCVATANGHKRYGRGRITIGDLNGILGGARGWALVVAPDHEYLDLLPEADVYVAVNARHNPHHSAYLKRPPIFWYQSHGIRRDDLRTISLLRGKADDGDHCHYLDPSHFEAAKQIPTSIENFRLFLDRASRDVVNLKVDRTPKFDVGDPGALFESLVRSKLRERYPDPTPEVLDRLEFELDTIKSFNFADYFLVLFDLISWARGNGIGIGPGRGSAAGSIVAYILGITQVEPISTGLMFERFLNPGRKGSFPDIDTDVDSDRRQEVIEYLVRRYGPERVASIVTHNRLFAKMALKDSAKIPSDPNDKKSPPRIPFQDINDTTKFMLHDAPLDGQGHIPEIAAFAEAHPDVWRDAKAIEGFCRQSSIHAAGIIVAPSDLRCMVGLDHDAKTGMSVCQLNMKDAEEFGLLKLDLLGLETISLFSRICKLIGLNYYDLEKLPLDDAEVYRSLHTGNGLGIFQFEGHQAQSLLRQIKPANLDELSATTALNRPGPLQPGLTRQYIHNKFSEKREYLLPEFETLLADTFGVFVFQEQVMAVAQSLASFSLARADTLRRAIGKKDHALMGSLQKDFTEGAVRNGYDGDDMEKLWSHIVSFADYCFNKSHSVAYSLLSYWGAYLRYYHPREFAASCLTSRVNDTDYLRLAIPRLSKIVTFYPPDANDPSADFRPHKEGVQIGLSAIKGMGATARAITEGAPFTDLGDLCAKANPDRSQLHKLCVTGALDSLGPRDVVHANLERALAYGKEARKVAVASLFGDTPTFALHTNLRKPTPNDSRIEIECYGFPIFQSFLTKNAWWLDHVPDDTAIGLVTEISRIFTRAKNEEMAFVSLATTKGDLRLVLFPRTWAAHKYTIFLDRCYAFTGRMETSVYRDEETENFIVENAIPEDFVRMKCVTVRADSDPMPPHHTAGDTPLKIVTKYYWRGTDHRVTYTPELHRHFLKQGLDVRIEV